MENTTTNADELIEVVTELTISDVKTLDFIVDACLDLNIFADVSKPIVQTLSAKLKSLVKNLDTA